MIMKENLDQICKLEEKDIVVDYIIYHTNKESQFKAK